MLNQPLAEKKKRFFLVDFLARFADKFQTLDAIIAEQGISLSPAIQNCNASNPLTFKEIVLAADFRLICNLVNQYPECFDHIHGLLYCLFHYILHGARRHKLFDIDSEQFTPLFHKLLLMEPDLLLFDSLISIRRFIVIIGRNLESEHIPYVFIEKLKEYETEIIRELKERKFIVEEGPPLEILMLSRIVQEECSITLCQFYLEWLIAIIYSGFERALTNDTEKSRWLNCLKQNGLSAAAILFHAVIEKNMEMIQLMKSAGIQISATPEVFTVLKRKITASMGFPLLHVVAEDFELRVPKDLLVEILRNKLYSGLSVSLDTQCNYQALTGEAFDEDQIFDPEDYHYDHTVILATASVFDCYPGALCIKHPRRTTLYEWSLKTGQLKLIQGIERSFKGKYKIVISSHGDGFVMSDNNKYEVNLLSVFGGAAVARRMHQLIMDQGGDKPSKITLSYCKVRSTSSLFDFGVRFTKKIAHLGYQTMVSAPRGCLYTSRRTGRNIYVKQGLFGLTSDLPFIKKCLPFWNEMQTKDKEKHDYLVGMGYKRVNNMKVVYRVENGKVTELDNPDLPDLV